MATLGHYYRCWKHGHVEKKDIKKEKNNSWKYCTKKK